MLVLDFKDALKTDENGADLDRALSSAQSLLAATDHGAAVDVQVSGMLPLLTCESPDAMLFAWTLLREAVAVGGAAKVLVDVNGSNVVVMLEPVEGALRARLDAALAGTGTDAAARYLTAFSREACGGTCDLEEKGEGARLVMRLPGRG
jgi:hypothetical protein